MPRTLSAKSDAPCKSSENSENRVVRPVKKTPKDERMEKRARTRAEVRKDLVSKYKSILKKGSYKIKAEEIADKMVQKIREDRNQVLF